MNQPTQRKEYRAVWYAGGAEFSGPIRGSLEWAERDRQRKEDAHGGEYRHMVSLQSRTVTPWVDLPEQGGEGS